MAGGGAARISVAWTQARVRISSSFGFALAFAVSASASEFFVFAPDAAANGRLPSADQLLLTRNDPSLVVLRTTFGVLISHDRGITWAWLCEDALGVPSNSTEDPSLALTTNGNLLAGSSKGLSLSPDTGCNWSRVGGPLADQFVVDLAVRPNAADVVLALTSTYGRGANDGGPGYTQQVFESTNDGADWSPRGTAIDPSALVTTLDVSAKDPNRIYVSAHRAGPVPRASLFVSTDNGATWTERPVPLDPAGHEVAVYIAAVDATSPDRVFLRTSAQGNLLSRPGTQPSRLLVTDDAGRSYRTALSLVGQMLGFALAADGSNVYAGSVEDGLFVAGAASLSFQKASSIHVKCLATLGTDLWACSDDMTGFLVGVSSDYGATFIAEAHLQAQPIVKCASNATVSVQCAGAPRDALCMELPGCDSDASSVGASASGVSVYVPHASSSGGRGCSLNAHDQGAAALPALAGLVALAAAARRRLARSAKAQY
jgi:photosystem II stability/assembly factor-like uncharacterized protein